MKRVGENEHLLVENKVEVDGKRTSSETLNNLIYQKPNGRLPLFGTPLRLHIYNLARPNIDSILRAKILENPRKVAWKTKLLSEKQFIQELKSRKGFNKWLKNTGEAPVIYNERLAEKTANGMRKYYFSKGWFNADITFEVEKDSNKRAEVTYKVTKNKPYTLDSINPIIATPIIDSIYKNQLRSESLIKKGQQYDAANFSAERDRIAIKLRNMGFYHFAQDYISFDIDTSYANRNVKTDLIIDNRAIRLEDSIRREPFKIYKIKEVNVFTDYKYENRNLQITDSLKYKDFNLYSYKKLKFRPKAITDAIFIHKDEVFRDLDRSRTYRYLSELRAFRYPNIDYVENEEDSTLTANVYLVPRKKFELNANFEVSRDNIQAVGFGFSGGLTIRNIFGGAENLQISALTAIGSSADASVRDDQFFDITELGGNLRLSIPRLFLPFNTDRIIPKFMSPSTSINFSATGQTNIGLDRQTLTGTINYNWYPSETVINNVDLLNVQFIRNLNTSNYFEVYGNSFNLLNQIARSTDYIPEDDDLGIPDEADQFINDVLQGNTSLTPTDDNFVTVNNIDQRKDRLTENNLIISSSFNYTKDRRDNLFDKDFSIIRARVEVAGNLLSTISNAIGSPRDENGRFDILNVPFSQYLKTEIDYVKHWDLGNKNEFAVRTFFGIAIPYGNSQSIPFLESFFSGGPNDVRAWTAFNLGPGSSNTTDEFNEANMKITLSAEQRFNILGRFNGAFFVDAGNIWNVLDNTEEDERTFDGLDSLRDIALGSGFGLRYDFSFFVLRFDVGFKTYNPALSRGNRWFKQYNFGNAVYNIGINYPF
ncbi:MAG: BamA/TamA family outer membrane protein [Bacteroidota bacterium]